MKKHIKFPSIEQYRHIVSTIIRQATFVGLDENGNPIYDNLRPKPTLTFTGTVKLHGSNAGVVFSNEDMWVQSRENVITPTKDNAGFAFFVESRKDIFNQLKNEILIKNNLNINDCIVSIFGEWAGSSIQKGVGISNIEKSLFIFGVKITPNEIEGETKQSSAYWVPFDYLRSPEDRIYNILDYQTFSIDIDFNNPELVQNKIIEMTLAVEEECPVAKAFGYDNTVGEGIVFSYTDENGARLMFKSKGQAHSNSKVKTLRPVNEEKLTKAQEIAVKVSPSWRLSQMIEQSCDLMNGGELDRSKLGKYLKMVIDDVVKEEMDLLIEAGLEIKDITKYVSEIAKNYFFEREKEFN